MRLTCPNCQAEYEVDDRAIPDAGRDVQCSSCGHTWFQLSATAATPTPTAEDEGDNAPAPRVEGTPARRRALDENIQSVLREEAEREKRARAAEGGVEIQPELGVPAPSRAPATNTAPPVAAPFVAAPSVNASPTAADAPEEDEETTEVDHAARRNLLPDIEQINSTLRAGGMTEAPGPALDSPQAALAAQDGHRRGFRRGFSLVILLFAILLLLYGMEPRLAARFPALAGPLNALHSGIDQYRAWLDRQVMTVVAMLGTHH